MLVADYTGQFKKDYKLAMKRGLDILLFDNLIQGISGTGITSNNSYFAIKKLFFTDYYYIYSIINNP